MRLKFRKGQQRKFIQIVLEKTGSPSLAELQNRGIDISYSTLKNYFSEARCLPEKLFLELCGIAKLNSENFKFEILNENWGKIKGGRIGKRR